MDATTAYLIVLALGTFAGAILHLVVPYGKNDDGTPETAIKNLKEIDLVRFLKRCGAGFFVSLILGGTLLSKIAFPIADVAFIEAISVPAISMSYFALDILKALIEKFKTPTI